MIKRMAPGLAGLVALCSCLLGGCSTCGTCPPPDDSVTVTVSTGPPIVFSWTPDRPIGKLIVIQGGPEDEYWASETLGVNTYRSPIEYGKHPPGAVENQIAQPLTPGETYTVVLFRWIGPDLDVDFRSVGSADFVP